MSEPSDAERKRIQDLEAKVLEMQEKDALKDKEMARDRELLKGYHDEKRAALDATAPQVEDFFKLLGTDEAATPYQMEHKEMTSWATNMCKDDNPSASLKLGRVMITASVRDKRQRDEIENLKVSSKNISDVAKERDELRAEAEVLRNKNTSLTEECTVKQTAIEKLSLDMKKYEALGMTHPSTAMTHQFSRLAERETPPASMNPPKTAVDDSPSTSMPVSAQRPSLTGWIMDQTSHMTDSQSMMYREKTSGSNALPSLI